MDRVSDSVSRETAAPPAELLVKLFGPRASLACRYAELLGTIGVERGLLGHRETPRIWNRHLLNCAVIAPLFTEGATVCDLGSGAGLPGIVLALARPDLRVTLLDPLLRRTTFLAEVVAELALPVDVVRARAEQMHGSLAVNYVTARAVAPLDRLATLALPLCTPGGEVIALKGSTARTELAQAAATLRKLGAMPATVQTFGQGVVDPLTTVVRLQSRAD